MLDLPDPAPMPWVRAPRTRNQVARSTWNGCDYAGLRIGGVGAAAGLGIGGVWLCNIKARVYAVRHCTCVLKFVLSGLERSN